MIPCRRKWQLTPVFWPGEFHGQRSLAGYRLWSLEDLDTTEWLTLQRYVITLGLKKQTIFFSKQYDLYITLKNGGKFLKRWEYQTTWPASWETRMQVRKQQLELDMEQQTGSKYGKGYAKGVYCHPAYLTSMQSTSWETLGWKKHKLESRSPGEISITSDMQMTPPLWQKVKRN